MTRDDMKKILFIMSKAYPTFQVKDSEEVDLWHEMLKDYEFQGIAAALKAYIATNNTAFAPSIGQLIGQYHSLVQQDQMSELQAWSYVRKALNNGLYGYVQEFEKLPPVIQQAVGSADNLHSWAISDLESIETVVQSNFLRSYRQCVAREKAARRIPVDVKNLIGTVTERMALNG